MAADPDELRPKPCGPKLGTSGLQKRDPECVCNRIIERFIIPTTVGVAWVFARPQLCIDQGMGRWQVGHQ
jgi:hypothetical protein